MFSVSTKVGVSPNLATQEQNERGSSRHKKAGNEHGIAVAKEIVAVSNSEPQSRCLFPFSRKAAPINTIDSIMSEIRSPIKPVVQVDGVKLMATIILSDGKSPFSIFGLGDGKQSVEIPAQIIKNHKPNVRTFILQDIVVPTLNKSCLVAPDLTVFCLSNCKMETIKDGAFDEIPDLERLVLNGVTFDTFDFKHIEPLVNLEEIVITTTNKDGLKFECSDASVLNNLIDVFTKRAKKESSKEPTINGKNLLMILKKLKLTPRSRMTVVTDNVSN